MEFFLTDTNGILSNHFDSGEDFVMHFIIKNETGEDQEYIFSGPLIGFYISLGDSLVSGSTGFLNSIAVIDSDVMRKNELFESKWRAPTPMFAPYKVTLLPGEYTAWAKPFLLFKINNFNPLPRKSIPFTVESD